MEGLKRNIAMNACAATQASYACGVCVCVWGEGLVMGREGLVMGREGGLRTDFTLTRLAALFTCLHGVKTAHSFYESLVS